MTSTNNQILLRIFREDGSLKAVMTMTRDTARALASMDEPQIEFDVTSEKVTVKPTKNYIA